MDWLAIREEFPDLNAPQVQQLLGEYQLNGKARPRGWYPPPEEVEAALRTCELMGKTYYCRSYFTRIGHLISMFTGNFVAYVL